MLHCILMPNIHDERDARPQRSDVGEVLIRRDADVHGPDAFATTMLPPIVSAVLTLEGRLVALLDVTSVVTVSDLEKVDSAIQALHASGDEARALPSLLDPVDDVLDPVEDDRANGGRP